MAMLPPARHGGQRGGSRPVLVDVGSAASSTPRGGSGSAAALGLGTRLGRTAPARSGSAGRPERPARAGRARRRSRGCGFAGRLGRRGGRGLRARASAFAAGSGRALWLGLTALGRLRLALRGFARLRGLGLAGAAGGVAASRRRAAASARSSQSSTAMLMHRSRAHTSVRIGDMARKASLARGVGPARARAPRHLCWRRARSGRRAGADPRPAARALAERPAHRGVAARARGRGAVPDGRVAGARAPGVSKAAVVRFGSRLGFGGYAGLSEAMAGAASQRLARQGGAGARRRTATCSTAGSSACLGDLEATRNAISDELLDSVASLLLGGRRAHLRVRPAQVGEPRRVRLLPAQPARPERAADRLGHRPRWPTCCSTCTPATAWSC